MPTNLMNSPRGAKSLACVFALLVATSVAGPQMAKQGSEDARIQRVLDGLRPPVAVKGIPSKKWALAERMASSHVPGVSIAVIDDGKIAWARGFGVKEAGAIDPVTVSTLFEAQSISKAVATTATLDLVNSGRLSLDQPANTYLKSWKIPDNEYQAQEKVTLRRILSHSSGLTVGGFSGYRTGDAIPSLLEVLNGEKPANNPPIRVDFTPGSMSRYSGGAMEVLQQLLMDATGQPFPELMKRLVLTPAGMTLSTYQEPLPVERQAEAASGHDAAGAVIKGKWPIHPEMAAAGLWTTPTDLAKWAIQITDAWDGKGSKLFSKKVAVEMLTVQKAPYGLGVELEGSGTSLQFSHAGSNAGFRAYVVMFPAIGKGAVVMTNADAGDAVTSNLITSIATEYHWPTGQQAERETVSLTDEQMNALVGVYSLPSGPKAEPVTYEVTRTGNSMFGQIIGLGPRPKDTFFPASATSLFSIGGWNIDFTLDSSGKATSLKFGTIVGVRKQ